MTVANDEPIDLHAIEQAVGAIIIRASWAEEQLGRVLHYLRRGDEFAVDPAICRMGWATLTKRIRAAALDHPDGAKWAALLETHEADRLGWIRHNTAHGRYDLTGGSTVSLRRIGMDSDKAFTVMGNANKFLEAARQMHLFAAAIEEVIPFGFGYPSGGRYLRFPLRVNGKVVED